MIRDPLNEIYLMVVLHFDFSKVSFPLFFTLFSLFLTFSTGRGRPASLAGAPPASTWSWRTPTASLNSGTMPIACLHQGESIAPLAKQNEAMVRKFSHPAKIFSERPRPPPPPFGGTNISALGHFFHFFRRFPCLGPIPLPN